jgi:hypothetical protein
MEDVKRELWLVVEWALSVFVDAESSEEVRALGAQLARQ